MARENRTFKMDDQLLVNVIKRQAGSLWKATIEGIMNAVDAGATKCDIDLTQPKLEIHDNGRGFRNREEIEKFFEVFGLPHEKQEQKTFGTFRMGRGQLFAYGHNVWRAGKFEMSVDINRNGLQYNLTDGLEHHEGCDITVLLYNRLTQTDFTTIAEEIKENAKYVRIECTLNGQKFTVDTSSAAWTIETADADIALRGGGSLHIYNQGIKVLSLPYSRLGCGGDVVTKKPVKVNFARNDVMSDCPVWNRIKKRLLQHTNAELTGTDQQSRRRARRMTHADRLRLAGQICDSELGGHAALTAKVAQQLNSSVWMSLRQLHKLGRGVITIVPTNMPRRWYHVTKSASRIKEAGLGVAVSEDTLRLFNAVSAEALARIWNNVLTYQRERFKYMPFVKLLKLLDGKFSIVADKDLPKASQLTLEILRESQNAMLLRVPNSGRRDRIRPRQILAGLGSRQHWTDGESFIAIEKETLANLKAGPIAWPQYMGMLAHEYLHVGVDTTGPHKHNRDFHAALSEWLSSYAAGYFCYTCVYNTARCASKMDRRLATGTLRRNDLVEQSQQLLESNPNAEAAPIVQEESHGNVPRRVADGRPVASR